MKRTILIFISVGILAITGCGRRTPSPQAPAPATDISAIDYGHVSDGIFYHGTVSLIGGNAEATWTLDDGTNKTSHDMAMTESTFKTIWDSVNTIPDFKGGAVTNSDQKLNPLGDFIIGVVSSEGGREKIQSYFIPAATASPAFREWLSKSGYPGK